MRFDENMNIVHDGRKETTQNIFWRKGKTRIITIMTHLMTIQ